MYQEHEKNVLVSTNIRNSYYISVRLGHHMFSEE